MNLPIRKSRNQMPVSVHKGEDSMNKKTLALFLALSFGLTWGIAAILIEALLGSDTSRVLYGVYVVNGVASAAIFAFRASTMRCWVVPLKES